jgi:hypothetical protein
VLFYARTTAILVGWIVERDRDTAKKTRTDKVKKRSKQFVPTQKKLSKNFVQVNMFKILSFGIRRF